MKLQLPSFKKIDYTLIIVVVLLCIFGYVAVSSATSNLFNPERYTQTQLRATLAGFLVIIIMMFVDYKILGHLYIPIYVISCGLLLAVRSFGVGAEDWGASRWLYIGGFGFQPSDFAKIGIIIVLAKVISKNKERINEPLTLLKILLLAIVPMGLVVIQPDLGTSLVFPVFTLAMLYVAGLKYRYIIFPFIGAVASAPFLWTRLGDYQKRRILVFLDPELDPMGDGWQITQSIYAVGSGMLQGKGLGEGIQSQWGFLPEKHTDFIFSVIAEEMGFIGVSVLLFLYMILLIKGLTIAKTQKDFFGSYLAVGLTSMLGFHIFVNIMMTIGLMPVTGKPLPFISYGGTFMLSNLIAIALLVSISIRRIKKPKYDV